MCCNIGGETVGHTFSGKNTTHLKRRIKAYHNNLKLSTNMGEGQKITLVLSSIIFLSHICWTWGQEVFVDHYSAIQGKLCYDACSKRGNDYYWCHTHKGWDYCSAEENTDYLGNKCRADQPCTKLKDASWCLTEDGILTFCGKVEEKAQHYISAKKQMVCHGECFIHSILGTSTCITDKGTDYCSPMPDVTYKNEPCRADHPCGTYGESYSWCYTASGWDYCGLIKSDECRYATRKEKGSCKNAMLICSQSEKQITFLAVSNTAIGDPSFGIFEIGDLISRWKSQAKSGLATTDKHHIKLQGTVKKNNQVYKNIEIQENTSSTVLGQVLIPQNEDIPDRFVRMALVESLKRRVTVVVGVSRGTAPFQSGPNCN